MRLYTARWISLLLTSFIVFSSCGSKKKAEKDTVAKAYTSPCGCVLSEEEMIRLCPVDAVGDSIFICKVGTNQVIGSNRPPMTWTEFIQSEYFGGEGLLVDCKTGDTLFPGLHSPMLSYKNKRLLVDEQIRMHVYHPIKNNWIDVDLPVWRKTVSSVNSRMQISTDSLIFKPPYQDKRAFESAAKEYEKEEKRSDHYMVSYSASLLLTCSLSGDTLSERRLRNLESRFADYYTNHEDSRNILHTKIKLLNAYKDHLRKGGKREYYDIKQFPIFQDLR